MSGFVPPFVRREGRRYGKATHWYEDGRGDKIPGVTTILDQGVPKPALVGWGIKSVAEYALDHWSELEKLTPSARLAELKGSPYAVRDAAANRGTEIHALAEQLLKGEEVAVPPELAGHVKAYVDFLNDWEPEVILAESSVVNFTVGYAGTLDKVVRLPGLCPVLGCGSGCVWLMDTKTGKGVYGDVALQLAAYRFAESHVGPAGGLLPMPEVDHCAVVHVREDGYKLIPVRADRDVFQEFRHAARVARWSSDLSKTVVGAPLQAERSA